MPRPFLCTLAIDRYMNMIDGKNNTTNSDDDDDRNNNIDNFTPYPHVVIVHSLYKTDHNNQRSGCAGKRCTENTPIHIYLRIISDNTPPT